MIATCVIPTKKGSKNKKICGGAKILPKIIKNAGKLIKEKC